MLHQHHFGIAVHRSNQMKEATQYFIVHEAGFPSFYKASITPYCQRINDFLGDAVGLINMDPVMWYCVLLRLCYHSENVHVITISFKFTSLASRRQSHYKSKIRVKSVITKRDRPLIKKKNTLVVENQFARTRTWCKLCGRNWRFLPITSQWFMISKHN